MRDLDIFCIGMESDMVCAVKTEGTYRQATLIALKWNLQIYIGFLFSHSGFALHTDYILKPVSVVDQ